MRAGQPAWAWARSAPRAAALRAAASPRDRSARVARRRRGTRGATPPRPGPRAEWPPARGAGGAAGASRAWPHRATRLGPRLECQIRYFGVYLLEVIAESIEHRLSI